MKSIKHIMSLTLILGVTATPCFAQTGERKLNIDEGMIHRRAIEVIAWSQPLMGFKAIRDAFFSTGANYNDLCYYSQLQNWKWQVPTPASCAHIRQSAIFRPVSNHPCLRARQACECRFGHDG